MMVFIGISRKNKWRWEVVREDDLKFLILGYRVHSENSEGNLPMNSEYP